MIHTKVILMDHCSNTESIYSMGNLYNILISMVGKVDARKIMVDLIENRVKSFECRKNKKLFTITYYE